MHHYSVDQDRLYGVSESMGSYGQMQWALRQPHLFAAVFMRVPILGPWLRIPSLIDVGQGGIPKTVVTKNDTLPNGTLYNDDTDIIRWIAQDCSRTLPYMSWSSGRRDQSLTNHRMWSYAVQLSDTLKNCHYGFSFAWGPSGHNAQTGNLENALIRRYQTRFARNLSYPAFTNFSGDGEYGNGDPALGAPSGCVNCGWEWKVLSDTKTSWSASIKNLESRGNVTTDVTPRNTQLFKLAPGTSVKWSASSGQSGAVSADRYGLVTVKGIELVSRKETTLSVEF
jgi:hypothetical protein